MKRWTVVLWLLVAVSAMAQDANTAARLKYDEAEALYKQGSYAAAFDMYRAAWELKPLPGFLFNMAQCQRLRGEHDKAIALYEQFIAESPKDSPPVVLARKHIQESRAQLALEVRNQQAVGIPRADLPPRVEPSVAPARPSGLETTARVEPQPLYKKWWLWTGVGAVVVGGVVAGVLLSQDKCRDASLGCVPLK